MQERWDSFQFSPDFALYVSPRLLPGSPGGPPQGFHIQVFQHDRLEVLC